VKVCGPEEPGKERGGVTVVLGKHSHHLVQSGHLVVWKRAPVVERKGRDLPSDSRARAVSKPHP